MMRDQDFGIVRVRAFGTFDFRIVEPKVFLKEVAGTDHQFRLDEFHDTMRSRIVSVFSDALASSKVPVLDLATRYSELGAALLPLINPEVTAKYGIEITSFILENASVPKEVEEAIDKRSSMGAVGNLDDYVKFQMAQGMEKGDGSTAGAAAQMGMGFVLAQQMARNLGTPQTTPPVAGATPTAGGAGPMLPDILTPTDVARALGVTEADVLASIDAGDLKGRKIGSAYRITKAALDAFLKG
jgi:excisionase family DNA binding protein